MGGACGKTKAAEDPKARQGPVEVAQAPPSPTSPQPPPAAGEASPDTKPAERAKEFITGEGDGVYLMMAAENNGSLVQQYAHSKPDVPESDSLLLQIKPPAYVEIKESRFVLQNGRRVLKTGILMAMDNADGQKKVCEAAMECVRLTCAYSGYIHAFPALADASFSILLVVVERHELESFKDGSDGMKYVTASIEMSQPDKEAKNPAEETEAPKEKEEKGKSADGDGEAKPEGTAQGEDSKDEKPAEGETEKGQSVFPNTFGQLVTETSETKALEHVQVLRHVNEGRSPNLSAMRFIVVVPLAKPKAQEVLKDGRVIAEADVEALQKQVDGLNGVMIPATPEKTA